MNPSHDHLGSASVMMGGDGSLWGGTAARYKPFGGYVGAKPVNYIQNRGFTGHDRTQADDALGVVYMNARVYMPSTGKFLTADTLVPDPKSSQSYNRYAYVNNNPINLTDPSGHCKFAPMPSGQEGPPARDPNDHVCWSTYDDLIAQGYEGLDPSWDYGSTDYPWILPEDSHDDGTGTAGWALVKCSGRGCTAGRYITINRSPILRLWKLISGQASSNPDGTLNMVHHWQYALVKLSDANHALAQWMADIMIVSGESAESAYSFFSNLAIGR